MAKISRPPVPKNYLRVFAREGALRTGHFLLSSGLHSGQYVQCALVLRRPAVASRLGRELARRLRGAPIDAVASPAVGGILVGHEVARALKVEHIFAEREGGRMAFRRGFHPKRGARYLVVEDVVTTGGSTREVMDAVRRAGGRIAGVAALVARGSGYSWQAPFHALLALTIPSYQAERCPLCREGLPLESPGSKRLRR